MIHKLTILLATFLLTINFCFSQTTPELEKALSSVNPDDVKARMTFLADDLIEGRQPGSRGFSIASKYVETQFIGLGLKPGADANSYVQQVPLRKGMVDASGSSFTLIDKAVQNQLTYSKEYLLAPYFLQEQSEVTAPLVFVGFGVSAPELNYDDYAKIDVKGKIVVFLSGAPASFPNDQRAHFSSSSKYIEAVQRGAVGVITFAPPTDTRSSWDASVKRTKQGSFKWLDKDGKPANSFDQLKAVAFFNPEFAAQLFAASGKDLQTIYANAKANKHQSFDMKITAQLKVKTKHSFVQSSNLIGILPGSDPLLKNEYVVFGAHLDHFGVGAPVNGDSIFNGAHDDASGVSILLGVAQAFKSLSSAPKRSIIFTIVTGEEYGLLGSDYFVNNTPVKINNIVADLTLDMPFFFHPILDIVPYGVQHSSLSKQVEQATSILNLKVSPDPQPEQVIFVRSDHYSFIKQGVPALFIKSGFMTVPSDTVNRAKSDVRWRSTIYHTPQDDMNQAFDFNAAAMHVKVNFLIGYFVAQDQSRPTWNKGDFFGDKYGAKKINLGVNK